MNFCRFFILFALAVIPMHELRAQAPSFSFLVPNEPEYFVYENDHMRIVYTEGHEPYIAHAAKIGKDIFKLYNDEYLWKLDEKPTLILASTKNQIANAFATVFPTLHTVFYPSGAELINEFSASSWLHILMLHETAHLYQLNVKHGYSQTLKKYFKAADPTPLPPFTYTMHPNIFLPTLFTEGNATFNEARFGNGGRLYNGAIRAIVLDLAKQNQLTPKRLINDHLAFPFGGEKYWVGGYFNLFLAEKFGTIRTNSFFHTNASYPWNPFLLNTALDEHFGFGYKTAFTQLRDYLQPYWSAQKAAAEPVLFRSSSHAGLTKDKNEIRFLTSDLRSYPVLRRLDLKTGNWTEETKNIPMGRVFRDGEMGYAVASSQLVTNENITAGLFGDGYEFKKDSADKFYYDKNDENSVYADQKKSLSEAQISSLNRELGPTQSTPMIGADNKIYFFRQNKKTRTLYSEDTALFSYKGYYGHPIEAPATHHVLFIGPSRNGSALYAWQNNQFWRLHPSDHIVDAKLISDEQAVVVEAHADGYEYKIVNLNKYDEPPFEYEYFFEKNQNFELFNDSAPTTTPATELKSRRLSYNDSSEWSLTGIDPYIFFGTETAFVASANLRFSDPLQFHQTSVFISGGDFGESKFGLEYRNQKHPLMWDLFGLYQKIAVVEEDPTLPDTYVVMDKFDSWLGAVGFSYPFFRRPQWVSSLNSHFVYQYEDPNILLGDIDQTFTLTTQLNVGHFVNHPLAFLPQRSFSFELAHDLLRAAPDWQDQGQKFGAQLNLSQDIFHQTYLSASYQSVMTDGQAPLIKINSSPGDYPFPTATTMNRNTIFNDFRYYSASRATIGLEQALPLKLYFTTWPLSLRRLSLIAVFNEYYGSRVKDKPETTLFREVGGGSNLELLALHKYAFRLKVLSYQSSFQNEKNVSIILGANF